MIINVPINRIIKNPWNTRQGEPDPEYVKALALDIVQNGLMQNPVGRLVTYYGDGNTVEVDWDVLGWVDGIIEMKLLEGNALRMQLAFGHNRLAAYRWLYELKDNSNIPGDWSRMPIELKLLSDEQMAVMAWSENEKRRDHTPLERALAIKRRMDDFGWNQVKVADTLGISRPVVGNALRLLDLPEEVKKALGDGRLSERQAMALLPLFDLPEEVLKKPTYYGYEPRVIVSKAIDGESSDWIRRNVEEAVKQRTRLLENIDFDVAGVVPETIPNVYCGLCTTCDKRIKSRNLCPDLDCFEAKTEYGRRQYLARASGNCGIPVVDPSYIKGGVVTELPGHEDKLQKILDIKCENLRLTWIGGQGQSNREDGRMVKGFPHARIVCDKRNGSCTCQKGMDVLARNPLKAMEEKIQAVKELDPEYEDPEYEGEDETPTQEEIDEDDGNGQVVQAGLTARDLEEAARQERKAKRDVTHHLDEAKEKIVAVLVEALQLDLPGVFYLLANNYAYAAEHRPGAMEMAIDRIYEKLANSLVLTLMPYDSANVDELYETINRRLDHLGLDNVYPGQTLVEMVEKEER
jgi:ParB/RepB/Spo0J family partition protein